jgi:hypothetical protein
MMEIEQIVKHFSDLDYVIDVKPYRKKGSEFTHAIHFIKGEGFVRLVRLTNKYFGWKIKEQIGRTLVKLSTFKYAGYDDVTNICRICGCSDLDACESTNGEKCWWVNDDLCSFCATPQEVAQELKLKKL